MRLIIPANAGEQGPSCRPSYTPPSSSRSRSPNRQSDRNAPAPPRRSFALATLSILAITLGFTDPARAASSFPSIDFDALGAVGVAGNFAGLDIWSEATSSLSPSNSFNPAAGTLIERSANGTLTKLNATETGGTIQAVCGRPNTAGSLFVAGDFSRMGSVAVNNIAHYDPDQQRWSNLNGGLDGPVEALLCTDELMIAGGSFTAPANLTEAGDTNRYLGAVAAWNYTSLAWQPLDFGGLNGTVLTLQPGQNASLVRFGGSFSTAFNGTGSGNATLGTNATALSGTVTSSTSLSNKWAPISLAMSLFEGGPATTQTDYDMASQLACPAGVDGPGNSFLFADGSAGSLTINLLRKEYARAFRIGNTFIDGRGTQNFSITALPSNTLLELQYIDPATDRNVTCTTQCNLYHNERIPYQDFIITDAAANGARNSTKTLTGFRIDISSWHGAGPGLHILQALSDGGWAAAYRSYNRAACNSTEVGVNGTGSDTTSSGDWYHTVLATQYDGVPEGVMAVRDDYSNLAAHADDQVSFNIDIPVTGNYSAYLHIPGCQRAGDCDERTDVLMTVLNNSTNPGTSVTVSQNVQVDTNVIIWDGEVEATSENFMPSVVLSIPSGATRPSSGTFRVIADRVRFVLRNSNQIPSMTAAVAGRGFGVFEYNLLDAPLSTSTLNNGTGVLPNTTMTELSAFGVTLQAAGASQNQSDFVTSIATHGNYTYIGGSFESSPFNATTGFQNFVRYRNDQALPNVTFTQPANGGLNGTVTAIVPMGDFIFVGGSFLGLADDAAIPPYIARFDPAANVWAALSDGPDGPVTSMQAIDASSLLVTGNFTTIANGTRSAGGYAILNATSNAWEQESALLIGQMSSVSVVNGTVYMTGSVQAISGSSASGSAGLEAPTTEGDPPTIESLNYFFESQTSTAASSTATTNATSSAVARSLKKPRASSHHRRSHFSSDETSDDIEARQQPRSFFSNLVDAMLSRSEAPEKRVVQPIKIPAPEQQQTLVRRQSATSGSSVPASLASDGSAEILASAFWLKSDGNYETFLGGNFTTTNGIRNLAAYDTNTSEIFAFPSYPASNTTNNPTIVRALTVVDDLLYVGGDGGLITFNMSSNEWLSTGQSLASTDSGNANLSVTAIAHRPDTGNVIVAGSFDAAGQLPCENICAFNSSSLQWTPLGSGLEGNVTALDFAGSKASQLIAAGDFTFNGASASLMSWSFDTQAWTALGQVGSATGQAPGPASAVSVDDLNENAIFVGGRNIAGTEPWLAKWDGSDYNLLQSSELLSATGISQLTFVPLTEPHPSNDILENNRLLVVSGALTMLNFGNVSSAFFDGQNWTPFLRSTRTSGSPGIVRAFSRATEVLRFSNLNHLAVGLVILISIAIGLGLVFLLVLLGLLFAIARRRPNRGVDVPISPSDELLAADKKRPDSLLATLNAATENVMTAGPAAGVASAGAYGHNRGESQPLTSSAGHDYSDPSSQYHSEAPTGMSGGQSAYFTDSDGHGGLGAGLAIGGATAGAGAAAAAARGGQSNTSGEGGEIEAHMRFSFEASHPSELAVRAGEQVTILDDADEHWWLARSEDGRVGVVPASYVL